MRLLHVLLIALAVSLTPVLAFNAGSTSARTESAAVAADSTSFLTLVNLGPSPTSYLSLANGNGYEDDALRITNAFSTTVYVQLSLSTNPEGRFVPSPLSATLAPGQQVTIKLQDDDSNHSRTCTSVVFRVDAYVGGSGASRKGHAIVSREVFVEVKGGC